MLKLRIYIFKNKQHMKWVYILAFDRSSDGWMTPEYLKATSLFLWLYIYMPLNDKSMLFSSYISTLEKTDRNVLIKGLAWIIIRCMSFFFFLFSFSRLPVESSSVTRQPLKITREGKESSCFIHLLCLSFLFYTLSSPQQGTKMNRYPKKYQSYTERKKKRSY